MTTYDCAAINKADEPEPIRWHYAVFKGGYHMEPACSDRRGWVKFQNHQGPQGIDRYRGNVNCPNCLKAMGADD